MAPHIWRDPPPEYRAAVTLHRVGHSIGLVLTANDPGHGQFSFRVDDDGVTELAGWGWCGPTIEVAEIRNPPPSLAAVHTVLVAVDRDGDPAGSPAVRAGVRALIAEHLDRYGDVLVWSAPGLPTPFTDWVSAGCQEDVPAVDPAA